LLKIIALEKNCGLGYALSIGLENCKNEIIARMDSDDISSPNRFQRQYQVMIDGNFDLVGANIEEFDKCPGDLTTYRILPEMQEDIVKFSKFRNPFNHPTVMFRKTRVINSGNYNANYLFFEDWHLFIRMINDGAKVYNIQEVLLFFRVNDKLDVIKRRSGLNYLYFEYEFSKFLLKSDHINFYEWVIYLLTKLPLRLLPPSILKLIYYKIARR
jgi:glycosyltransferase involved in cell wall biosynthesis